MERDPIGVRPEVDRQPTENNEGEETREMD